MMFVYGAFLPVLRLMTVAFSQYKSATFSFSISAATFRMTSRQASAAFFAAAPETYVVLDAYAPLSNGVMSVSDE